MTLYHYFDKRTGPFRNLSCLSEESANRVFTEIKRQYPSSQCAKRDDGYLGRRQYYENLVRQLFDDMGGKRTNDFPHYMVVEHCEWLYHCYEQPAFIKIPVDKFDLNTLSFTYGDMHPTFSPIVTDGKEYRKKLYDYDGIVDVISRYGLPQEHAYHGEIGFPYYVEVQVWTDDMIAQYQHESFWETL